MSGLYGNVSVGRQQAETELINDLRVNRQPPKLMRSLTG